MPEAQIDASPDLDFSINGRRIEVTGKVAVPYAKIQPMDITNSVRASPDEVLENHTVVLRDGRMLDLLPTTLATLRYAATVHVDRSLHLVLPGLVNAYTRIVPPPGIAIDMTRSADALNALLIFARGLAACL